MSQRPTREGGALSLLLVAAIVARTGVVGHAPDAADAACAVVFAGFFVFFGAGRAVSTATAALLLAALCAVPASRAPWTSFLSLSLVAGSLAALGVGAAAPRQAVLGGLAVAGSLHGVVALVQRFVTWPAVLAAPHDFPPSLVQRVAGLRPLGLSLSPDLGAATALAGLVAALALVVDARDRADESDGSDDRPARDDRVVVAGAVAAAVVCAVAVVVSRSYGVFVCAGAGVVVYAARQRSWRALSLLAVAAAGVVVVAWNRGLGALATSAHERWRNWEIAFDAFRDAPLLGQGLARFAPAYLERRTPDANLTRYAHSAPLQWLSETGVVGGAALVVAVVVIAAAVWPRRSQAADTPRAGAARAHDVVVAGAAALCARGLLDYDFQVAQTATLSCLVVGLALHRRPRSDGGRAGVVVAGAVAVVALCAAAGFVVRAAAPGSVIGVDVDLAFAAVDDGADVATTLGPFTAEVAPAAVRVAAVKLAAGDVDAAAALVDAALARDPALAPAWVLKVRIAEARGGDVEAVVAAAARWGVRFEPVR